MGLERKSRAWVMEDGGLSDPEDDLDMWDHEEWCCLSFEDHGCPCICHVPPAWGASDA